MNSLLITTAGVVIFVIGLILLRITVPLTRRMIAEREQGTALPLRIEDATAEKIPPPQAVQPAIDRLTALKFSPVSTQRLVYDEENAQLTWIYADESGTIAAEVNEAARAAVLMTLTTWFSDQSCVQTIYPWGATINTPEFVSQVVRSSPEDALKMHSERVAQSNRGNPVPVKDVTIDFTRRFLERFSPLQNTKLYRGSLLIALLTVGLGSLSLALGVVLVTNSDSVGVFIASLAVLAVYAAVLIRAVFAFAGGLINAQRKAAKAKN